ncbi:MAG: hypothetical protein DI535_07000 [Citrobacter freundii]|nr:MAG: hypothetical protein DI535_07000 [Citrobacter freundii]
MQMAQYAQPYPKMNDYEDTVQIMHPFRLICTVSFPAFPKGPRKDYSCSFDIGYRQSHIK